ncbi:MAG TPA: hypothetical protein VKU01_34220 [Bryobacteraceae bacterium]|nr:hypothetical protein [Bryobacteraceae bacterium]
MHRYLIATSLLLSYCGLAQTVEREPVAIIELGGASSRNIRGGSSVGGDVAVEFTPIENWLEIEVGTSSLFARHSAEWDTDLLFKKPWTLSRKVEFMVGIGPEWVHARQFGIKKNSLAGEFALDLMYWPGAKHKLGCFVEPAYEYTFGHGHERAIGLSWGLLIAIP